MGVMIFRDRLEAGEKLAEKLSGYRDKKDAVVLGIPRGGVVVAGVVARELHLPLEVIVTRKLPAPGNPELAIGAVDSRGRVFLREELVELLRVAQGYLEKAIQEQVLEAKRREAAFRSGQPPLNLTGKTAIIVDDGLATGATALAAVRLAKAAGVASVVLAVPVAPPETVTLLKTEVDNLVVLDVPDSFAAVGQFYESFEQVSDDEVTRLLKSP